MKWAIGPRRLGKTSLLLRQVLTFGKSCFVASPTRNMALTNLQMFCKILEENDMVFTLHKHNLTVFLGEKIRIEFGHADKLLEPVPPSEQEDRVPVFMDDIDLWLAHKFKSQIRMVTGTGPNYVWNRKLPKEFLETAKARMPKNEFLNEMTQEWI